MKPPVAINDPVFIQKLKNGDEQVFQELFESFAPKIYHYTLTFINNENDAEELVQEVFVKIWEHRSAIDQKQNLNAYIYKIAVNRIYDFVRRRNVENAFKQYALLNYDTETNETWQGLVYEEMKTMIKRLVNRMPTQRRKIFKLSKEDGLSNSEIAHKMKISKRTVENQLYRAIAYLKKNINEGSPPLR